MALRYSASAPTTLPLRYSSSPRFTKTAGSRRLTSSTNSSATVRPHATTIDAIATNRVLIRRFAIEAPAVRADAGSPRLRLFVERYRDALNVTPLTGGRSAGEVR